MMSQRERDSLDAYITGNYGEDQFKSFEVCYSKGWVSPDDWVCELPSGHVGEHGAFLFRHESVYWTADEGRDEEEWPTGPQGPE